MKGLRKMPKFLDLGLKVVLSVSMVMGSVPTAALENRPVAPKSWPRKVPSALMSSK